MADFYMAKYRGKKPEIVVVGWFSPIKVDTDSQNLLKVKKSNEAHYEFCLIKIFLLETARLLYCRVSMKMYIITTDSWGVIVCQSSDYFRKNKNITECFQVCHGNEGHNTAGSRADGKRV